MEYIYKISFYETEYSMTSHTSTYFLKPDHVQWAFDTDVISKIFYIKVSINSKEYETAVTNSRIMESDTDCYIAD